MEPKHLLVVAGSQQFSWTIKNNLICSPQLVAIILGRQKMGSHHQENIENDPKISSVDQNDTSMRSTRQEGGR